MRRPIDWGWLVFYVLVLAAGGTLLWFTLEAINGVVTDSMVFVKSSETPTHVLVKVYADGHRIGVLAFLKERWAQIEERGGVEIYVGTAYQEDRL